MNRGANLYNKSRWVLSTSIQSSLLYSRGRCRSRYFKNKLYFATSTATDADSASLPHIHIYCVCIIYIYIYIATKDDGLIHRLYT